MIQFHRFLLALGLGILLWQCAAPVVLYDYDTTTVFSGYTTFSWREATSSGPQLDTLADRAVRQAVERALGEKGLRLVSGGGDLSAVYHIGNKEQINVPASGYAYWPERWAWGGYYQGATTYVYAPDALIIDLVDDAQEQLVWRGSLDKVFRPGTPERISNDIRIAVDSILTFFPPPRREG